MARGRAPRRCRPPSPPAPWLPRAGKPRPRPPRLKGPPRRLGSRLGLAPLRVTPPRGWPGWAAAPPPCAMHLPPAGPAAPGVTGHRSAGRLVTPASACPRSGHRLRGPGQEPGDVPRAADPRDHVQVSRGRARAAWAPAASAKDAASRRRHPARLRDGHRLKRSSPRAPRPAARRSRLICWPCRCDVVKNENGSWVTPVSSGPRSQTSLGVT